MYTMASKDVDDIGRSVRTGLGRNLGLRQLDFKRFQSCQGILVVFNGVFGPSEGLTETLGPGMCNMAFSDVDDIR